VSTVICFLQGTSISSSSYSPKLATVISDAIAFVKCIVDQEDLLLMYWESFIAELRGGDMKLAASMACRVDQLFTNK
jgi:inhibitor of KinA sporulation pathway (predicted exonuclease)